MDLTFSVLRPDDLVALDIHAVNLRLDTSRASRPRLVRDGAGDALLVVELAPQSIVEQAFYQTAKAEPPPVPPPAGVPAPPASPGTSDALLPPGQAGARMAGASRLVLKLPTGVDEIPYTVAGVLDWRHLELVLPPAAQVLPGQSSVTGQAPPPIAEPTDETTVIELPYRLLTAPSLTRNGKPIFVHALDAVTHDGRTELWHTRLGRRGDRGVLTEATPTSPLPVRVVWSPDFVGDDSLPAHTTDEKPFVAPMSKRDRDQIVILNAGYAGYTLTDTAGPHTYVPEPIQADRLFLSALGGWLSSRGAWKFPVSYHYVPRIPPVPRPIEKAQPLEGRAHAPLEVRAHALADAPVEGAIKVPIGLPVAALDLIEWDHVATQGRDHYVRIVYEGFLLPFGHRASLVKVTERKVHAPHGSAGNPDGSPVAYLRQRMYVVVREHDKTYDPAGFVYGGLEMPMRAGVTITTRVTPEIDMPTWVGNSSFLVSVGNAPYPFSVRGTDEAGHHAAFTAPLMFVSLAETNLTAVRDFYAGDDARRRCAVRGSNIAYADPTAGDTTLKTRSLYFTAEVTTAAPPYVDAPFLPSLDSAAVTVPALQALVGADTAVQIALYPRYLQHGLDPNAGVFAQVVGTPPPVSFSADKSGGFARPNLALTALSARKGLVSGSADDAASGVIDPAAYFGDIDARLFGTIDLGELIPLDAITHTAGAATNAPEMRTHAIPNRRHPTMLKTIINWEPQLQDYQPSGSPVSIVFNSDGQRSELKLHVRLEQPLDGTPPTSLAQGRLSNFELRLFGVIALKIGSINFDSSNGAKSIVTLDLASTQPIAFEGPLEFIQTLADILPPGLFGGSGPSITLGKKALRVSYTLGLPPITCGVFSLEHIAIMAALDLPYLDGKPAVEFAFASRSKPFLVTVEIFGGGGFVHVVLDADGIRMVEGSIEFGANFCLDLGVASGAVHAMAGIYFQLKGSSSDLAGFVDIGGEVSVLGIISISIDLNLSLSWQSSPSGNVIQGRATLTVSVHVLFFSASVELSVERSFSAGSGDPKVDQLMSAAQWHEYAGSFA